MTTHDWYVEHREAYVARSLEPGEERAFRNHLVHCDECARGTDRLERELGWLGMAVDPVPAEPGRARRMAGEILARPNRWRRWLPLAAAAALALVAGGAALSGRSERRELRTLLAEREGELAALQDTLSVLRRAHQVLQTRISMDGHEGGLLIFQDAVSAAVRVWWVSPTYSHCFLIVPIVAWLAWEKRPALAATAPALFPQALLLMPLLGLMWWMGRGSRSD